GILVRSLGKITHVGDGFFYIDDGTRLSDGMIPGVTGVRVESNEFVRLGQFVAVNGISRCITNGEGKVHPRIKATEINILKDN
ncbi:MAG: hypothetical protein J6U98_09830, partial [Abditibacteriota bacterium]|nr:hypothetical protein [Abditibacteriota bacterium]